MRIAIDIRALMEGRNTGVQVYLMNLLESLFAIDQKNEFVLWANSFSRVKLPEFNHPNVRAIITRYPNKLFNLAQKMGWPKLEKLIGEFDLFFSPHWRVTSLAPKTILVVTFHDLVSEFAPEFFTWRMRIWHQFMNYRNASSRAQKIIAVSESTKRDLIKFYGITSDTIEVIYPGVNIPSQVLDYKGSANSYFLYLGTIEPRKNIEAVISAYAEYYEQSSIRRPLVIAGSHGWKTHLLIPQNLRRAIQIKNDVGEEAKAELYRHAFAFVFPSYYEGFGFPVLEAASFGLPVITSYNSSLLETTRDFALFASPFRPSRIARAMLELENDEQLRVDLSQKGQRVARQFNWNDTARKTLDIFEKLNIQHADRH